MRSPSQTTPTSAGPTVSPITRAAVATVTEPRWSADVRARNAAPPPSSSAYVAGLDSRCPGETESISRTDTSTTPKPNPAARPSTSPRPRSGSRPPASPTPSTASATPSIANFSASDPSSSPSVPEARPSIARPAHTTATAPHSARLSRTRSSRAATTAVTARLDARAALTA